MLYETLLPPAPLGVPDGSGGGLGGAKGLVYVALGQVMVGRLNPSFDGRSVELAGFDSHSPHTS